MERIRIAVAVALALLFCPLASLAQNIRFDPDVTPALKNQVLDDLNWIFGIEGPQASPLHQEIFGTLHGGAYSNWIAARIFYFGVDTCGGGGSVACVKSRYKNKVFVTNQYIRGNYPQVARLMTLFHEARHTETDNGMWAHAYCPNDSSIRSIWTGRNLAGSRSCDPSAYGSYASASVLLNNISKFCSNCSAKAKADAKIYSDDQIKRVVGSAAIARIRADFAH